MFLGPADFITPVSQVLTQIQGIFSKIMSAMHSTLFLQIIAIVIIIGKCIFSAFNFFIQFIIWSFKDFILWMFIGKTGGGKDGKAWQNIMTPKRDDEKVKACFLCWLIRYIIVIAYKITTLPKCFLWYFLDTAGWVLYLPFRCTFWLIDWLLNMGIVKMEHNSWDFLDQIDYFVHGKPRDNYFMYQYKPSNDKIDSDGNPLVNGLDPKTMNLGFHIIHFPNSVMFQCYSISPYGMLDFPPFPMKALIEFLSCAMSPF